MTFVAYSFLRRNHRVFVKTNVAWMKVVCQQQEETLSKSFYYDDIMMKVIYFQQPRRPYANF